MNETASALPAKIGGTEVTRFNALRHGVLSRYAVLPWEDAAEYRDLVASLVAEHAPHGPTEEHLVEKLAGILWRKRRLRLAEAAAHRKGLEDELFGRKLRTFDPKRMEIARRVSNGLGRSRSCLEVRAALGASAGF
jgi:hypothetical protein